MSQQSLKDSQSDAGFFGLVRTALAGGDRDYTKLPIKRAVALLAIPMVLEMSMESAFALADIFFVSRLGADAIAVVGLTEAVITLVYAIAVGLGTATTALVARRIGRGEKADAASFAGQGLWVGLAVSLIIAAIGIAMGPRILLLMGASAEVAAMGSGYTQILLGGSLTVVYLFLVGAIFRGAGDAAIAMRALWIANGCNILLDPCLIFGLGPFPELGVTGAAVATTIGRGIGVAYGLWQLFGNRGRLQMTSAALRPRPDAIRRVLRVAGGGIMQHLIATSSWIVLMRLTAVFGSAAIAGLSIGIRLIDFTLLPAWGLGNAAATLVGQNLGADKPQRAEQAVWRVVRYNCWFLLVVATVFIVGAPWIVGWFASDPEVLRYGILALRLISAGYVFFAIGMVLMQAFNGAGDTWTPTAINFVCFWLLQIPLAWVLSAWTPLGPTGVFLAITVSESMVALLAWWRFRLGEWRDTVV
ncbi:MAG: MATE family efflux transporter [Gammaproteobacteria bacterium]|nr:MATE family efflux transporter [Gammaproteobacteria bacterium]